ncbi:unnamed protein product [Ilex paraguariensis]|uniref:Uncharacterized protein n=1 Tax=Ilex paraguariensis TaxID=185542 RepID=A0ABC8V669_9AQUA
MYSSSNTDNPLPYTDQTLFRHCSTYDQNPNFRNEDPPYLLYFPSPFLDENDLIFSHTPPPHLMAVQGGLIETETETAMGIGKTNTATIKKAEVIPKKSSIDAAPPKRSGKKDRHSKIYTAQGLRDRRMRLSLPIAREFFDLQDMLGFDKASKTIEWLFMKSKTSIKEIIKNLPQMNNCSRCEGKSESPMSECVVASRMEETAVDGERKGLSATVETLVGVQNKRKSRKGAHNPLARESRDKARARARERTRERKMISSLGNSKQWYEPNPDSNLEQLGSSNAFETGEETSSHCQEKSSSLEANSHSDSLEHQLANVAIIENPFGTASKTSRSVFDYDQNYNSISSSGIDSDNHFLGFPGNWNINNARLNSNHYAMTNVDPEGNLSSIFMATSNSHCQPRY